MTKEPNNLKISENGNSKHENDEFKSIIKSIDNNTTNNENKTQSHFIISNSSIPSINNNFHNSENININSSNLLNNLLNDKNLLNSINNSNQNNSSLNLNKSDINNSYQLPNTVGNNNNFCSNNNNIHNINFFMQNVISNTNINIKESSQNNDDNAIYLIDSEEEKEEGDNPDNNKNNNNNNNNNQNQESTINNILKMENNIINKPRNFIFKRAKNNLFVIGPNNPKNINSDINNKNDNITNNNNTINNNESNKKINEINNENSNIKDGERKLYYRRRININKKSKYKGKDKLNVQVFIGNYSKNQSLPTFIFGNEKFSFTPKYCRQTTQNYKGYIISFPGLVNSFNKAVIKKDLEHMCTYYFKQKRGKQNSSDIYVKDEKTLNDGVFLNDGIVNFYLKIIEDEYTCGEGKSNNVLIQKSFFYNSLSNQQNSNLSNDFCYPDSCSFIRTKINVFTFKTLIIPICENYHWSLIIVNDIDKMKNIFTNSNLEECNNDCYYINNDNNMNEDELEYPEVFYLDSFYELNYRRMIIILKYLFYEYQKIYGIKCNMSEFFMTNFRKIECYSPDIPKQNNSYDCGIFLLMYAELFLYNPEYFLKNVSKKYNSKNENENENELNKNQNITSVDQNNNTLSNNYNANNSFVNNNLTNNENNTNNINNIFNNKNDNKNIIVCNFSSSNYLSLENFEGNSVPLNDLNSLKMNENKVNNNTIIDNDKIISNEIPQKENENKDNPKNTNINYDEINIINTNINKSELDKIDIEIDDTENKIKNNECLNTNTNININHEYNTFNPNLYNNQNEYNDMGMNSDMKFEQINEKSLRNWFSFELVNRQRDKIKNLIYELSKIENSVAKSGSKEIRQEIIKKEQNTIIKKYVEEQKKEFDNYFSKLED